MGTTEQRALEDLLTRLFSESVTTEDDTTQTRRARKLLAGVDLWTLGVSEAAGGTGADPALTTALFAWLGGRFAALGWACVQAHAAAEMLGGAHAWLADAIHTGEAAVAVIDSHQLIRADAADERPYVVHLCGAGATLYAPEDLTFRRMATTGLAGALTVHVIPTAPGVALEAVDIAAARLRLRLGAAAVAAGIASEAAKKAYDYAAARFQFGVPLSSIPAVQSTVFHLAGTAEATLLQLYAVDTVPAWKAAALLGAACEAAVTVSAGAAQVHGGYGYLREYGVERLLRDAVSLRAAVHMTSVRQSGTEELCTQP